MRTTQTNPSRHLRGAFDKQKVRADVVLGSPSANCGGVGICRVMAYGEGAAISCPKVASWICLTQDNKIRIEFLKSSMEGRFMRRHFRWMLFQVFEAYVIPYPLLTGCKIEHRTIRPGIYQVWESVDRLFVEF